MDLDHWVGLDGFDELKICLSMLLGILMITVIVTITNIFEVFMNKTLNDRYH